MTSGFPDSLASARASANQFAAYARWLAILLNDTLPEYGGVLTSLRRKGASTFERVRGAFFAWEKSLVHKVTSCPARANASAMSQ